jgi:hypothetical protein
MVNHRSQRIETLSRNGDVRSIGVRRQAMHRRTTNRRHSRHSFLAFYAVCFPHGIALTWVKLPC